VETCAFSTKLSVFQFQPLIHFPENAWENDLSGLSKPLMKHPDKSIWSYNNILAEQIISSIRPMLFLADFSYLA
jgi:hypothetical protein